MTRTPISSVALHYDYDVVAARRRARQIASQLEFDPQEQTRIATVASEIARNALRHGGGGRFEFAVDTGAGGDFLVMTVLDNGPGVPNVGDILSGRIPSGDRGGFGIVGARRLMDEFAMASTPGKGTTVVMMKRLPRGRASLTRPQLAAISEDLASRQPENPLSEMQQQNGELLQALASLSDRQEELQRLNRELEDTNRGVLALYAELDEKADSLRRADQLKSAFLSDMSHEFRTPLNSILALTTLLDEGTLGPEPRKQVSLIRRATQDLEALVNDLLDLARIEAGKAVLRPVEFTAEKLFSALRGMLRPLFAESPVALIFDDVLALPPIYSDEGKVTQILRNFLSNAMKFTESGEVRVGAGLMPGGEKVSFFVADTGIGIAHEHQERIFEEFAQIDNPLQHRKRGTGLGLPLSRKLAQLLGGEVRVVSELGAGSTFFAELPLRLNEAREPEVRSRTAARDALAEQRLRILIVDDDATARYTLASFAARRGIEIIEAESGTVGLMRAQADRPDVIMLDLMMPGIGGHEVLQRLKSDPLTAAIPVVVVTSRFVNDEEQRQILTRAVAVIYKGDLSRDVVKKAIDKAAAIKP